ncbi:hypothetical protein HMPREF0742_00294 [Rothia aeria F0184]|uniref:Uncharacterized protein n=1 Tax=Rothia aeria F0184 TaxID=888019 RepID=U7V8B9_9MICC|nr:hypothetical protein HMPREF0742_00294 [Rothia aeria F0184]
MPLLDSQARPESRRYKGQAHGGAQTNARTLRVHGPTQCTAPHPSTAAYRFMNKNTSLTNKYALGWF